jgi:hypothetical protein
MRSPRCAAISVVVLLAVAVPAAGDSPPPGADEALLEDVGPGWSRTECPATGGPGAGATFCFAPDARPSGDWLAIGAVPVFEGADADAYFDIAAAQLAGEPFATPSLGTAQGSVIDGDSSQATLGIVMATDDYVFTLYLLSSAPLADAKGLLLDVARRQQDHAGGPLTPGSEEDAASSLDSLLLTPPSGSGLEIMSTSNATLDLADLRAEARSQRVVDLMSEAPARLRVLSWGGVPAVIVTLSEEPYGVFAATGLGSLADLPPDRRFHAPQLDRLADAIGFRLPAEGADQLGVAFRKGRYMATVTVVPIGGANEDAVAQQLVDLAERQAARLPEGATAPYFFPSATRSIAMTIVLTTAICGGALGLGRLSAARRRRRTRGPELRIERSTAISGEVVDVSRTASALRRRGAVLAVVDLVAANAVVVGALGVTGALRLPTPLTVALLTIGVVGGMLFTAWWARSELRRGRSGGAFAVELQPSMISLVGGLAALALLLTGTAFVATGVAGLAFGPSLSGLERSQRLHVEPTLLNVAATAIGSVLLAVGGYAVRLTRMWARANAERLRARDQRPPILYLRSFEDDALMLPTILSARRPFLELLAVRGADPFEESIAWQIAPYGPVVAIGRPGRPLQSLGAARDHLPDDVWRVGVVERMAAAQAIVVILGSTEGLRWELAQLVVGGHLTRTVFVFPPALADVVRDRWHFTGAALAASGIAEPSLPVPGEHVLAAVPDRSGVWRVAVADVRDEATFRSALDQAMAWISDGREDGEARLAHLAQGYQPPGC